MPQTWTIGHDIVNWGSVTFFLQVKRGHSLINSQLLINMYMFTTLHKPNYDKNCNICGDISISLLKILRPHIWSHILELVIHMICDDWHMSHVNGFAIVNKLILKNFDIIFMKNIKIRQKKFYLFLLFPWFILH